MSLSDEQLVEILGGDIPAKTFERLREAIEQNERPDFPKTGPYVYLEKTRVYKLCNPEYGDDRMCECGYIYYRHFDWMEDDAECSCKYCGCYEFKEL